MGEKKEGAEPLVEDSALSLLQCFDTVCQMTEMASSLQKICADIHKKFSLGTSEEKIQHRLATSVSNEKTDIKR